MNEISLLKQSDLEKMLNLKPSTLEQMRLTGRGPKFCKVGRSVRYRLGDVQAWIEANVFSSTAEADAARG